MNSQIKNSLYSIGARIASLFQQLPMNENLVRKEWTYALIGQSGSLPGYLGDAVIDPNSVRRYGERFSACYCKFRKGRMTDELIYRVDFNGMEYTVNYFFEGKFYRKATHPELQMAFFTGFQIEKGEDAAHLITDKGLFSIASELMEKSCYVAMYSAKYLYFPAALVLKVDVPLARSNPEQWKSFHKRMENAPGSETIFKHSHSPFFSIDKSGSCTVALAFVCDAVDLLITAGFQGKMKEEAIRVIV
jgi:hypothetical protein